MLSTKSRLWLLPLTFALSACVAILPPDEKDDGVERCENSEECADPGDTRLEAVCYNDEDLTQNAPGVCISQYVEPNCDASLWESVPEADRPQWAQMVFDAQDAAAAYVCTAENKGKRGCAPRGASDPGEPGCDAGLVEEMVGGLLICHDPESTLMTLGADVNRAGEDVAHAYCRAFFGCDSAFVCDFSTNGGKCKPCDPTKGPDDGGCVEMWINGEIATTYNGLTCNEGSLEEDDIAVGMHNEPV